MEEEKKRIEKPCDRIAPMRLHRIDSNEIVVNECAQRGFPSSHDHHPHPTRADLVG